MPTLLTAGDASNGVVLTSSNDNALTIQTGAAGAKVNAIALDSAGQATLIQPPKLAASATVSMVRLNTANGYGSTNTMIRRFTNTVTNQGSDITYADSATLGATFTINTAGVYSISYSDNFSAATQMGLSLNSSQLTTAINSIAVADVLAASTSQGANGTTLVQWTGYLPAGSVVRAHDSAVTTGTLTTQVQFTIVKVA